MQRHRNIKNIRNEKDYQSALKRIDNLMNAESATPEGDELEILAILIERYEEKEFPIEVSMLGKGNYEFIK